MAWLWITISWIITAVSICIVCLIKRNMRQAARSIREIVQTNTTQQLLLSVPQKDTEALFKEINGLISAKREGDLQHARRENELRQEIANITHDLRTPLTSVLGYLQLMQDDKLPEQERQRYLDIVQSRARALQALITGLYDLSRLEAGGYVLQREPIQVQSLLYELAAAFYYDFQEAGIEPDLEGVLARHAAHSSRQGSGGSGVYQSVPKCTQTCIGKVSHYGLLPGNMAPYDVF